MKKYQNLETLNNYKSVCLIAHIDPDADALASMVVLKEFIDKQFKIKTVDIFAECQNLPFTSMEILGETTLNKTPSNYQVAIMMDCPNLDRLGVYKNLFEKAKHKIVIDHHATNNFNGDINFVEFCSSTCEIVYNILKEYQFEISKENQGKLYSGIITDTNNFTVGNITNTTFEIASKFNQLIDRDLIYNTFLNSNSLKSMQLLALAIQNIELYNNDNILFSYITRKEMKKLSASAEDFTGIINKLATINNAKLVCFVQPKKSNFYVSLRAKNGYDISKIAKSQGGGGHTGAAAYLSSKCIKQIKTFIINELSKELNNNILTPKKLF